MRWTLEHATSHIAREPTTQVTCSITTRPLEAQRGLAHDGLGYHPMALEEVQKEEIPQYYAHRGVL